MPDILPPYDLVRENFKFPFNLYPFQIEAVNELAPLPRTGIYWECGCGKTAGATHCALYHALYEVDTVVGILPPILITQWKRWLETVTYKDGRHLDVLAYRGTPTERKAMSLNHLFVLMSIQIFKRDYERIVKETMHRNIHVLVDEAHCIKDVGTDNYKKVRDFSYGRSIQLLTGTPLNQPLDAYAYIKTVAPNVYKNLAQFERTHVKSRDFFNKPTEFMNLDLLRDNLLINADRKTKEDVLTDLPDCVITEIPYELDKKHMALYKQLVNEQLLLLPDGEKIDATSVQRLLHSMGQIIMQWHHFAQDESLKSAGYDVVEEVIEELGGKKLIVFANYKRTNQALVDRLGCNGIWGDTSAKDKEKYWDEFLTDPACKVIVLNPAAAGIGLDNAQHCCQEIIYLEPPVSLSQWTQSLSRVHRSGQRKVVTVRMAVALGTIQQKQIRSLSDKEALVNPLQGSKAELRAALFGEVVTPKSCLVTA